MRKQMKARRPSNATRRKVWERDNGCIFCGSYDSPTMAHYISKAKNGLGIEQNMAIVCMECHRKMDHTEQRPEYLKRFKEYLDNLYPDFPDEEREWKRWMESL